MSTDRNDLEKYFEWWLNELKDHGYIRGYDREAETFPLFPNYKAIRLNYFKTKEPEHEEFNFMHNRFYNYDYNIKWTEKANNIFFQEADFKDHNKPQIFNYRNIYFVAHWVESEKCHVSYVDVKPPAAGNQNVQNTSYHTFPLKQQILLWLRGVYINKVIPFPMGGTGKTISLFPNTFTPRRYLITDGGTRNRKITTFQVKLLDEYIKERLEEIQQIEDDLKKIYDKEKPSGQTTLL